MTQSLWTKKVPQTYHQVLRVNCIKLPPASTKRMAEVSRKQWPVYMLGLGKFKNVAISAGTLALWLTPAGCLVQTPLAY